MSGAVDRRDHRRDRPRVSGTARSSTGAVVVSGGALDLDNSPPDENLALGLTVSSGTLTGDSDLRAFEFGWRAGRWRAPAPCSSKATSSACTRSSGPSLKFLGRHLRNDGLLVWSDGAILMDATGDGAPHLDNHGTFEIAGDDFAQLWHGAAATITNRPGATITKTGTGTATLEKTAASSSTTAGSSWTPASCGSPGRSPGSRARP